MRDPLERFMEKVNFAGDCWEWTAARTKKGYGQFRAGTMRQAHRWFWEQVVGPVSPDLELDHLCKNRACVNPIHLEPVTHAENIRRADSPSAGLKKSWARKHAERTHCPNGHEFTEENTLRYPGKRMCRTCNIEKSRAWRERRLVAA
jgi:hypothetical protein